MLNDAMNIKTNQVQVLLLRNLHLVQRYIIIPGHEVKYKQIYYTMTSSQVWGPDGWKYGRGEE